MIFKLGVPFSGVVIADSADKLVFIKFKLNCPAGACVYLVVTASGKLRAAGQIDFIHAFVGAEGPALKARHMSVTGKIEHSIIFCENAAKPFAVILGIIPRKMSADKCGLSICRGFGKSAVKELILLIAYRKFADAQLLGSESDEIITVDEEDAYTFGRLLGNKEGILVGITSGAAMYAAVQVAKRPEYAGKNIVTLLPDTGDRYLSTPMFE